MEAGHNLLPMLNDEDFTTVDGGVLSEVRLTAETLPSELGGRIVGREVGVYPIYASPEGGIVTVDAEAVTLGSEGPRKDSAKFPRMA